MVREDTNQGMEDLEKANPGVDPTKLKVGQEINLPIPEKQRQEQQNNEDYPDSNALVPHGVNLETRYNFNDYFGNKDQELKKSMEIGNGWKGYVFQNKKTGELKELAYLWPNEDYSNIPMEGSTKNKVFRAIFNTLSRPGTLYGNIMGGYSQGFNESILKNIGDDNYRGQIWYFKFDYLFDYQKLK